MMLATIKVTTSKLLRFDLTSCSSARRRYKQDRHTGRSMIIPSLILAIILSFAMNSARGSILSRKIHHHHDLTISSALSHRALRAHAGRPTRQAVDETSGQTDLVAPSADAADDSSTGATEKDDKGNNDDNQAKQSSVSTSTDNIIKMLDSNFLNTSGVDQGDAPKQMESMQIQSLDEMSDNSLSSLKASTAKRRKQAENQIKVADWWSKIASKNKRLAGIDPFKSQQPTWQPSPPSSIYKEQPLTQNSILTIRNQLHAIRDKHRLLLTRSVSQLVQLDQKLVDSYKLCLRKKMPLYAGMLYRTRSFLTRMARDIRQEREILEAITKQTQKVLRRNISNSTLVKDYNRLTLDSSTPATQLPGNYSLRPGQRTYTVHINEVNLRLELMKAQALIDRINASSFELTSVVDDIIYMFKLTANDYNGKKGLLSSGKIGRYEKNYGGSVLMDLVNGMNQKGAKRLPFKLLFERYGSQAMRSTIPSDNGPTDASFMDLNTNNMPELGPLFDQETNSTAHLEPTESEMGFDVPIVIENK